MTRDRYRFFRLVILAGALTTAFAANVDAAINAKDVREADGKDGSDAIPYADLRKECKDAHTKQKELEGSLRNCRELTDKKEIAVRIHEWEACRAQRIEVRRLFNKAIARVEKDLAKIHKDDLVKPALERILKQLEGSATNHTAQIKQATTTIEECKGKLKK